MRQRFCNLVYIFRDEHYVFITFNHIFKRKCVQLELTTKMYKFKTETNGWIFLMEFFWRGRHGLVSPFGCFLFCLFSSIDHFTMFAVCRVC